MDTKNINTTGNKKNNKSGMAAGAGIAAGVVGAAAGYGASAITNPDEEIVENIPEEVENTEEIAENNSDANNEEAQNASSNTTAPHPATEEIQPIDSQEVASNTNNNPVNNPVNTPTPDDPTPNNVVDPNNVDPTEIAQAIVAGEEIDPNDVDMEDLVSFEEVTTIYGENGEEYLGASFVDNEGNVGYMVDVDGDEVFDLVTDDDLNVIANAPTGMNIGDAELDIETPDTYLASNETDPIIDYQDEIMDNIIDTDLA